MKVLLLGATGTIGASTARALHQQGHETVCVLRAPSAQLLHATCVFADPCDPKTWGGTLREGAPFDAVISCLASRTGAPCDAWRVDYQAHIDILEAVQQAGIKHFVLLSAICVQKPRLAFQKAKLRFEQALMATGMTYSIVRPTAYFKSLSGQLERVKNGKAFLVFGDGLGTACKPISDRDLADYLTGCLTDPNRQQKILPIGGPGDAITPIAQGEALFKALGQPARFTHVPVRLLDVIIGVLSIMGRLFPAAADKAELAKIGRYYATESMLVWDPQTSQYRADATPSHGRDHLFDAYADWAHGEAVPERREHAVF
jgi:divinyl chlorophyllide a 8-vinyl-reductase